MKINIIGHLSIQGDVEVSLNETLKTLYKRLGGQKSPHMIQVGGALGLLLKDYDINTSIETLQSEFYEPSIAYINDFCPVDYMRFMCRFVLRELNIVNDFTRKIYDLVNGMTENKTSTTDYNYLKILIKDIPDSLGEKLLLRNLTKIIEFYEEDILKHLQGHCKLGICRGLIDAQCINACPAHIHIPGFVALMKDGKYEDAYALMRQENPLSGVCGSICARPCELRCRRGEITGTVGVRALQRFITSEALEHWKYKETCLENNDKHIGIIGGGPSGLTAAYYLRRTGYDVTIYEKHSEAGGMLSYGVPKYRLPQHDIQEEVKTIESLGVTIKTNIEVGKDITFDMIKKNHDAVLLATGTQVGRKMKVEHGHVLSGIDFLKGIHLNQLKDYGSNILVVGGGDVAMDCARTAIRLDSQVTVMSLESFEEMPASYEEKTQAIEEGVTFKCGFGITEVQGQNIHLNKCIEVLDDAKMFKPIFESSDEMLCEIDMIVFAIGQSTDLDYVTDAYQNINGMSLGQQVFACGDMIRPTIVIDAIAQGKTVATLIDSSLGGNGLYFGDEIEIPEKVLNIRTFDYDLREIKTLEKKDRIHTFDQVNLNYSIEDAIYEADRCMRCDRNSKASLLLGR